MVAVLKRDILYQFDKIQEYVPDCMINFLDRFHWLSLRLYNGVVRVYGGKGGVYYPKEEVFALFERKWSPKFEPLLSLIAMTRFGCWEWCGPSEDGVAMTPGNKSRWDKPRPAALLMHQLVFKTYPARIWMKCGNLMCVRPSHMSETEVCPTTMSPTITP